MATIERRISIEGRETFRVKIRLRGGKTASATFERKQDAKRWAAETETEIKNGRYFKRIEAKKHTVGEMIDRYCLEVLPQKRDSTKYGQAFQFKWWKVQIGHELLSGVSPALLAVCRDRLIRDKDAPRSPTTAKRYLAALSHAFTIAMKDWQWIEENPMARVTMPKESRGRVRFLSDDERSALLKACSKSANPLLYPIVLMAISTGARKGEILGLKWKDVNLARGAVTFQDTKNSDRRTVPVRGTALEALRGLPRRIDTDLVFAGPDGTMPAKIRAHWESSLIEAKVTDFRFHDLRHSCASYLAMSGATTAEIAAVLGHRTLAMVKRYSHIGEQHTAAVLERMHSKILGDRG
ncbi:MAG: site-specific integrase [Oligoflexia bacterium]|nr:site-specific integrase [Oligoflexia bacterium]